MISTLMELISLLSSCLDILISGRCEPVRFKVTRTSVLFAARYCSKIKVMIISPEA